MDVNILNVAKLIFNDVSSRFFKETPITAEEIELKDRIVEVIESYVKSTPIFIKCDPDLEMIKQESDIEVGKEGNLDLNESENEIESFEESSGEESPDYHIPSPDGKQRMEVSFDDKKRAVEYWLSGKKGRLHWRTVANTFRFVKSPRQLYRFKKQIDRRGSKEHKMRILWNYTLNKLKLAKEQNMNIGDTDLRKWALDKNLEVQLDTFKASRSWIQKLKRHYRNFSREENFQ
ncbi:uncharacterized protein LOC111626516 [Centruroides sculpturatus]|uniref:uncharacterized protein LOC111626494 n=1 Tax=Centruroides sculpturatus TaxID=218467 RepID=UPI000C6CD181|nr:uncharacterized protein LOC111626494 [Centruroides sculpturatus]XP_023225683.1 uncharacterized protein LOC111626516 [Centruroides sculpturatus]